MTWVLLINLGYRNSAPLTWGVTESGGHTGQGWLSEPSEKPRGKIYLRLESSRPSCRIISDSPGGLWFKGERAYRSGPLGETVPAHNFQLHPLTRLGLFGNQKI